MPCTFDTTRKPRGPPNRRVAEAKAQGHDTTIRPSETENAAVLSPPRSEISSLVVGLTVEHFCAREVFELLISDYLEHIYPLHPLVHRPQFRADFQNKRYHSDPFFYRLCISISAVTISCSPRNFQSYGFHPQETAASMVERAHRLVLLSRTSQSLPTGIQPDIKDMVCSCIISVALLSSGRTYHGWAYASEAVLCMRKLSLFKPESHNALNQIESEICKRAFWTIFVIMAHDRLAYPVPHTGVSYNPACIDWNFLVLLEVDDPEPGGMTGNQASAVTPLLAGFVALIKIYICAVVLGRDQLPGAPRYGEFSPPCMGGTPKSCDKTMLTFEEGLDIIQVLRSVTSQLPDELKLFDRNGRPNHCALPFAISRASVYLTSLFIQSIIVATLSANNYLSQQSNQQYNQMDPQHTTQFEDSRGFDRRLLDICHKIAQETLHIITITPSSALKANGTAAVSMLREITATLLNCKIECPHLDDGEEEQVQSCVKRLIATLVELDHVKQIHQE